MAELGLQMREEVHCHRVVPAHPDLARRLGDPVARTLRLEPHRRELAVLARGINLLVRGQAHVLASHFHRIDHQRGPHAIGDMGRLRLRAL